MTKNEEELDDIKLILVGEPGTGKTSLINVSIGEQFTENSPSTLLSTFVPKKFEKNKKVYTINIWDTAGQEKFRAMTKIFIKNSKIVVFVYSIDNKESFEEIQNYWFKTIKDILGDEAILGIVGNKCDLFLEEKIKEEEAKSYADELKIKFKLVSAKEDPGGFIEFIEELLDEYLLKKYQIENVERETININKENENNKLNKPKKNCC